MAGGLREEGIGAGSWSGVARTLLLVGVVLLFIGLLLILADSGQADSVSQASATLPEGRSNLNAIWGDGAAFVIGGKSGGVASDTIVRFDPATGSVTTMGARLPTGRLDGSAAWDATRGVAYYFGGKKTDGTVLDETLRFDPVSNGVSVQGARLPVPLHGASAVWNGTHAYIFGGCPYTDAILRYDPLTDTISVTGSKLPTSRCGTSAIWDGSNAYIFGGASASGQLREIVRYDPASGAVTIMNAMLPNAGSGTTAAWDGRSAYVFGGYDGGPARFDKISRYDPATDSILPTSALLPSGREGAGAVWDGSHIYVFGGWSGASDLKEIVRYTPTLSNQTPTPSFTISINGLTVSLNGGASSDPDGSIASYSWDWGDGSTGTGLTATHTYATSGTRTITLMVTDDKGATGNSSKNVTVSSAVGDLYTLPDGAKKYEGTDGETILQSVSQQVINTTPGASFSLSGTFRIWSSGGCGIIKQAFWIASWTPSWPPPAGYYAPLYEGQPCDQPGVTQTKSVTFTVPNAAGTYHLYFASGADYSMAQAVGKYSTPLSPPAHVQVNVAAPPPPPNQPPVAKFNFTVNGLNVNVDGSGSFDPDGTIAAYSWSWDDGTPVGSGATTSHTYASTGTYTITLTVTDNSSASASASRVVNVTFGDQQWAKSPTNPIPFFSNQSTQPGVTFNGGVYHAWWVNGTSGHGVIDYARSNDGVGWTRIGTALDESSLGRSTVLVENNVFKMWYRCSSIICYAESSDGLTWNRLGGVTGLTSAHGHPEVAKLGSTYHMFYAMGPGGPVGMATSSDGRSWTSYSGNPVLATTSNSWENRWLYMADIIVEGGVLKAWYWAQSQSDVTHFGYAESTDGIQWTRSATPILSRVSGTWENNIGYPTVVHDSCGYRMWYTGTPNNFFSQTGVAMWTADRSDYVGACGTVAPQPPQLPDLVVLDIARSPASPPADQPVTFTATVKNQGNGPSGPYWVRLTIDGALLGERFVSALAAGASVGVSSDSWKATTGNHTIRVVADSRSDVPETNEANNERTEAFSVRQEPSPQSRPDFVIDDIAVDKTVAGSPSTITCTYRNKGSVNAGSGYDIRIGVDSDVTTVNSNGPSVNSGQSKTATRTMTIDSAGTHRVYCYVNQNRAVPEVSYDDSGSSKDFTWTSPKPSPKPPIAAFSLSANELTVSVDATGSIDPDGTIVEYSWDWADKSPSATGALQTHTYATDGTYIITLQVTDDAGNVGKQTKLVTVVTKKITLETTWDLRGVVTDPDGMAPAGSGYFLSIESDGPNKAIVRKHSTSNPRNAVSTVTLPDGADRGVAQDGSSYWHVSGVLFKSRAGASSPDANYRPSCTNPNVPSGNYEDLVLRDGFLWLLRADGSTTDIVKVDRSTGACVTAWRSNMPGEAASIAWDPDRKVFWVGLYKKNAIVELDGTDPSRILNTYWVSGIKGSTAMAYVDGYLYSGYSQSPEGYPALAKLRLPPVPTSTPPVASLVGDATKGPAPLTVAFTLDASVRGASIAEWKLEFDDGKVESGKGSPAGTVRFHPYSNPGTFDAKLQVTDTMGRTAQSTVRIEVGGFDDAGDSRETARTLLIGEEFPGEVGGSDSRDVFKALLQYGQKVRVIVKPLSGMDIDWYVHLPGGTTSAYTLASVEDEHHDISPVQTQADHYVEVVSRSGQKARYSVVFKDLDAEGNRQPSASLSVPVTTGTAPLEVKFRISASDPDGGSLRWILSYGDGQSEQGVWPDHREALHVYSAGIRVATLSVFDGRGGVGTSQVEIRATQRTSSESAAPGIADLVIHNIVPSVRRIGVGSTVTADVTVSNQGTGMGVVKLDCKFLSPRSDFESPLQTARFELGPGSTKIERTCEWKVPLYAPAGTYTILAKASTSGQLMEITTQQFALLVDAPYSYWHSFENASGKKAIHYHFVRGDAEHVRTAAGVLDVAKLASLGASVWAGDIFAPIQLLWGAGQMVNPTIERSKDGSVDILITEEGPAFACVYSGFTPVEVTNIWSGVRDVPCAAGLVGIGYGTPILAFEIPIVGWEVGHPFSRIPAPAYYQIPPTALWRAVGEGVVAGEVKVTAASKVGETQPVVETRPYSKDITVVGEPTANGVKVTVESAVNRGEGKLVVMTLGPQVFGAMTPKGLDVRVDGKRISLANDYGDIVNPKDDGGEPEYLVTSGANALQVLVSIPHFSTRVITIERASDSEDDRPQPPALPDTKIGRAIRDNPQLREHAGTFASGASEFVGHLDTGIALVDRALEIRSFLKSQQAFGKSAWDVVTTADPSTAAAFNGIEETGRVLRDAKNELQSLSGASGELEAAITAYASDPSSANEDRVRQAFSQAIPVYERVAERTDEAAAALRGAETQVRSVQSILAGQRNVPLVGGFIGEAADRVGGLVEGMSSASGTIENLGSTLRHDAGIMSEALKSPGLSIPAVEVPGVLVATVLAMLLTRQLGSKHTRHDK